MFIDIWKGVKNNDDFRENANTDIITKQRRINFENMVKTMINAPMSQTANIKDQNKKFKYRISNDR